MLNLLAARSEARAAARADADDDNKDEVDDGFCVLVFPFPFPCPDLSKGLFFFLNEDDFVGAMNLEVRSGGCRLFWFSSCCSLVAFFPFRRASFRLLPPRLVFVVDDIDAADADVSTIDLDRVGFTMAAAATIGLGIATRLSVLFSFTPASYRPYKYKQANAFLTLLYLSLSLLSLHTAYYPNNRARNV